MAIVCNSEQLQWQRVAAHKIGNDVPNHTKPHHLVLKNEHNSPALTVQIVSLGLMVNEHRKGACLYQCHVQTPPPTTHRKQNIPILAVKTLQHHWFSFAFLALHIPTLKHSVHKHAGWSGEEQSKKKNILKTMAR